MTCSEGCWVDEYGDSYADVHTDSDIKESSYLTLKY